MFNGTLVRMSSAREHVLNGNLELRREKPHHGGLRSLPKADLIGTDQRTRVVPLSITMALA